MKNEQFLKKRKKACHEIFITNMRNCKYIIREMPCNSKQYNKLTMQ